jgi:hypothetical protein
MVGNACLLATPRGTTPPSLAGSCTGYQTALRLQGRAVRASLAPCSGAAAGLVTPCASHEGGRTAQRGEGMPSEQEQCGSRPGSRENV